MTQPTFGLVGVAGFVAPKHIDAIHACGGRLVWACDPHDAVGVLDRHGWGVEFLRATYPVCNAPRVDYVVIASPNDQHVGHATAAMRCGAHAIVEKPVALTAREVDTLRGVEAETQRRVFPVLQLRLHPAILALRARIAGAARRHDVEVRYVAPRGPWYDHSWKSDPTRSGGVETNIGVHIFDALLSLFGPVVDSVVTDRSRRTSAGSLELGDASVGWVISTDPSMTRGAGCRAVVVDGETFSLTDIGSLHVAVYREILAGRWYGLDDAAPAVALCESLRGAALRSEAA